MYMIDPPQLLQARPIITPGGGMLPKSLESWKVGRPKNYLKCYGIICLEYQIPWTYLSAIFWKILLVFRTKFLTPASLQQPQIRLLTPYGVSDISLPISPISPFSSLACSTMYFSKICCFYRVVYPATSILSSLSRRGGNMVSRELAVQTKSTLERSIQISIKSSLKRQFCTGSKIYITESCRLAPPPLLTILSISSSSITGFSTFDLKILSQILPGYAPMQVLRWPFTTAVSYSPPSEILAQGLFRHLAMDLTMEVLPTPGGPYNRSTFDLNSPFKLLTAMNQRILRLSFCMPQWSSQSIFLALKMSNYSLASTPKGYQVNKLTQCFFRLMS